MRSPDLILAIILTLLAAAGCDAFASPTLDASGYLAPEALDPGDWRVCTEGEFHVATTYRVCCPADKIDDCRIITDGSDCLAVENHACDRHPDLDTHACRNAGGIYIKGPQCDAGDKFLCAEGELTSGIALVCCEDDNPGECIEWADVACPAGHSAHCSFNPPA